MRASGAGNRSTWRQCFEDKEASVRFCFLPHLPKRVIIHRFQNINTIFSIGSDPSPQWRQIRLWGQMLLCHVADGRHGVALMYQLGRAAV